MKITDIKTWLDRCKNACFAIQLPNGWLGRPYDNQHRLEDYEITSNKISIRFDGQRQLVIFNYSDIRFEVDDSNNQIAKFENYSKIEFVWFPYDKTLNEVSTQVFNDGELVLYGKYFN